MPKKPKKINWSEHKENWSDCMECGLCTHRKNVVLGKGKLPADVIFVGEAPGSVEDYTGVPFKGPAGGLLKEMVDAAQDLSGTEDLRIFYTNLVSCIPYSEGSMKTRNPEEEEIEACARRLNESVRIAGAKGIVMVGRLSAKFAPRFIDYDFDFSIEIVHPAAILRADEALRGITAQKTILNLETFFTQVSHAKTT